MRPFLIAVCVAVVLSSPVPAPDRDESSRSGAAAQPRPKLILQITVDHKKYSVGENAGFKLDEDGGIEIHIAAEKPEGVPVENWLPINRGDETLDLVMRIYAPDLEKMKTWIPPKAEMINE